MPEISQGAREASAARIATKGMEEQEAKERQLGLPFISSSFRVRSGAAKEAESAAAPAKAKCQLGTNQAAIKPMITYLLRIKMFK